MIPFRARITFEVEVEVDARDEDHAEQRFTYVVEKIGSPRQLFDEILFPDAEWDDDDETPEDEGAPRVVRAFRLERREISSL